MGNLTHVREKSGGEKRVVNPLDPFPGFVLKEHSSCRH